MRVKLKLVEIQLQRFYVVVCYMANLQMFKFHAKP